MKLKDLKINQVTFYYQTYLGEVDAVDDDGFLTGDTDISYTNPIKAKARISPNTNEATDMPFGREVVYDKMISTVQDLPIDESSKLFVDVTPEIASDGSTTTEPDYSVVKVARDLQQKVWAIRKINGYNSQPIE